MKGPTRLGRWLRAVRAVKGHTQDEAATACGTHPTTIGAWEAGALPSLQGLLAIRAYADGVVSVVQPESLDDLAEWARQPVDEVTP